MGTVTAEVNKVSAFQQEKNEKKVDLNNPCHFCGQKGHGKFPAKEVRQKSCSAWNKACDKCGKIGHLSSVCKLKDGQKVTANTVVTANAVGEKKAMFNKVAAIQGIRQCKKKLKLDHVEWSRELGWRKAAPLGMPKLAVDIKVLKDEQQLLYRPPQLRI